MKSLMELERHECRFPVLCVGGDEGFCAEHVEGIDTYCAEHRRLAGGARVLKAWPKTEVRLPDGRLLRKDRHGGSYAVNSTATRDYSAVDHQPEHEPDLFELFGLDR